VWRTCVWVGNGDRALHQGDVEIQFYRVATRRLDAGIGDQADQDHPGNAMLPELDVEVDVGEAVLAPMLLSDDTAQLRRAIAMHLLSQLSFAKTCN
jgi:hypothetical protein